MMMLLNMIQSIQIRVRTIIEIVRKGYVKTETSSVFTSSANFISG